MSAWQLRRLAQFPSAVGVLCLIACEPSLDVGARCGGASECGAPLRCVAGRCRQECVEHRDCALMARCVVGAQGFGACTLEDDAACDASRPCGDGLLCVGGGCFDPCLGASCPAGGVCVAGLCSRPEERADGGAPPVWPAHRSCTTNAECNAGEVCSALGADQYACRRSCTSEAECSVPGTRSGCVVAADAVGLDVSVCTVPCDVVTGAGCRAGEACDVFGINGVADWSVVSECRPIDPAARRQGESCVDGSPAGRDSSLCAAGLSCSGLTSPDWSCQALCTLDGAFLPSCDEALICTSIDATYLGSSVGVCTPPPTP